MCNIPDYQLRALEKEEIACKDIRHLMCDYADNELTPTLKTRLDSHIESCHKCNYFKETYLKTIKLAGELPLRPLDSGIQNRLRQALNERLGINLSPIAVEPSTLSNE